ncbi:hypothetical protein LEP1GSC203_1036 [Leptospira terpstrae serovar Hualin str. LT 11-33 = ATCC 700639]|uniref:Uncharacterized protein n=1 Tax=Leptospira terpstrae serovar Hualin str. LT 11-33 = ATCC 700639 TaxID=1257025 RepID=N1VSX9_9LEPT|nr:hypothetical protein LEP1GSC203_1036 [Leptospira terpstrae serovar Hualin str. LT 11-33 = ATCC 700639]
MAKKRKPVCLIRPALGMESVLVFARKLGEEGEKQLIIEQNT